MHFVFRYKGSSLKDLKKLDKRVAKRIDRKLEEYCAYENPLRFAKPLRGSLLGFYRFRIGEYRVIFEVDEQGNLFVLSVLHIGHRKDVYLE